jgi:hypothetical protein
MEYLELEVKSLISLWKERAENGTQSNDYKCAVSECVAELQKYLAHTEEYLYDLKYNMPSEDAREYIEEQEADAYLSLMSE